MQYVKTFEQFISENYDNKYVKLCDIVEFPDEDELLSQFIGIYDYKETYFLVKNIDPIDWYNNHTVNGTTTIKEAFERFAEPWQKKLVNKYRKEINAVKQGYVIISGTTLVDGFHRLVAMALENQTELNAVDLEIEKPV